MKKAKLLFITFSLFLVTLLSSCFTKSFKRIEQLEYVSWKTDDNRISFKCAKESDGVGYIELDSKKYLAHFEFYFMKSLVIISIFKDGEFLSDSFVCNDVDDNNVASSRRNDVKLFGNDFGRIELKYTECAHNIFHPYEENEYYKNEETSFELHPFTSEDIEYAYYKVCYIYKEGKKTSYNLKWMDDNKFKIYDSEIDYKTINETTSFIEEGSYSIGNDLEYTLHFENTSRVFNTTEIVFKA